MQRMINNTETVIDEMLEGYVNSYPDEYRKLDQGNILMRREYRGQGFRYYWGRRRQ